METLTMPETLTRRMPDGISLASLSCEELEKRQVEIMNRTPGRLTGLDCPACQNRGYFVRLDEQCRRYNEECGCMAQRRSLRRIRESGLADTLARCTFENYQTAEPWQREAKRMALAFVDDAPGKWFCAVGAVGAGKTHLCTAICGALLNRGLGVRYMRWRDEGGRLKAAVNDSETYGRLMAPLKKARVLYIDDFFKTGQGKEVTQGDINLAFELLDCRYADRRLTTVISSERTIAEILSVDEAVGSRIYERSREYCLSLSGKGKNWRLK